MVVNSAEFEYDVALSFAGENREVVEKLATLLKAGGFSVFYDNWKKAELWGKDLYQHLDEVYSKKARFCVMFISAQYAAKAWTNHELKAAQTRAFQKSEDYILPVRLDDTEIPGIRPTVGYLDLRKDSIDDVAAIAVEKITASRSRGGESQAQATPAAEKQAARSNNLQLKKKFTDQDRDAVLEDSYEVIAKYFEESLAGLQQENTGVVGKFRRINANHFTAIVYLDGRNVSQCGIRLGGGFGKQIVYSTDPNSTNSMNEGVGVADDGHAMFLKAVGFSTMLGGRGQAKERLTSEEAAELFWNLLLAPLQR